MDATNLADANPATGIVGAYRFRPDGAAEPISQDKIETALAERGSGWIWLHLALADTRCRNRIAQHAPISELAREVLAGPDRHLRLDILGQEIIGVVPDLHQEFAQLGENLVRLRFVMTERMLIRRGNVRRIRSRAIGEQSKVGSAFRPQFRFSTQ
jgi:zinc transporter